MLIIYSFVNIVLTIFKSRFVRKRLYRIGYSQFGFDTDQNNFSFIENQPGKYFADPFLFKYKKTKYILCENFSIAEKKGVISIFKINSDGVPFLLGNCIEENYHLSFPFIFTFKNDLFIVPETKTEGTIYLYRCIKWPFKWKKLATNIYGANFVDTIIFPHNGKWWLFTTSSGITNDLLQSELYIYHSNDPIAKNWKPHSMNPVIINSYYGRNSGFFIHKQHKYRCSQAMKKNKYGSEITFHRINKLTPSEYKEEIVHFGDLVDCHTFDTKYGMTVIDRKN